MDSTVKYREFSIDGDTVRVPVIYDEVINQHVNDYPDFIKEPRFTPDGRPWVNVTYDGCPFADKEYGDCGSCRFFRCEKHGDLIGVCDNEKLLTIRKDA